MKKTLHTIALSFFIGSTLLAQDKVQKCNTYDAMEQHFKEDPSARVRYEEEQEKLRIATQQYEASLSNVKMGAAVQYTIPVVFHILHTNGPENISDANCIASLANINNDYARTGSDTGTISPLFKSLYINCDIKFMLAHKDPYGNCTSGIVHHYNTNTQWNQASPNYIYSGTGAGQWNPTKYLNIYVVKSICPTSQTCSTSGGVIQGYTYKPGTWATGAPQDVFVVVSSEVNSIPSNARTLSHEIGHWLNLSHTFGNTNNPGVTCGDDGISDTPMTKGYFSTCPSSSTGNTCVGSGQANVENIMDYSSCPKNFTAGQTNVMRAALASSTSGRNNLWSSANLLATDVAGTGSCPPIADFYASSGVATGIYTVCAGGSLNFTDISYNATITARSWSASGACVVASPTTASTGITFPNIGTETVTLLVSSASGTATTTKTVNVLNGIANYATTYQEGFEPVGLPANWTIINQTGGTTWQQYFGAAATGNGSYYMNNSVNPNNAIDILETPSYDFLNNPGATYTFKYAYAQYSSSNADVFKIQVSKDCGGSWTDISIGANTVLQSGSGGVTSTAFYPSPSQYKLYTLTSHPAFNQFKIQPNVRIRFYFMEDPAAGFGNNFFLDDINFNAPLGVNELSQSIGLSVYPNPTSGVCNVEFTLSNNSNVKYYVTDVVGRVVEQSKSMDLTPGAHKLTINENQKLTQGIYMVNFELNGTKISRKLIVE